MENNNTKLYLIVEF